VKKSVVDAGIERIYIMLTEKAQLGPVVYVIDDDSEARKLVSDLMHSFGFQVQTFDNPEAFLNELSDSRPGCVVLDIRMPGMDGLEVQQRLAKGNIPISVIILTGYAETPTTVRALRNGAVAVLDKPFREDELWSYVQEGIQRSEDELFRRKHLSIVESRVKKLTQQDREVMRLMLEGVKNRSIAKRLEVSLRTVENRRRKVFEVMQAESVAELARMVTEYEHGLAPKQNAHERWIGLPHERVA
jgi:two-component system response regulator FixJ